MRFRLFVALASLFASTASPATWHQASSPHFLIYADMPAARLQEFATKLEKFDKAVRVARNSPEMPKSDGNRLTLFVVSSQSALRRLVQDKTGWVAGMYQGRASGSIAFVPRSAGTGELDLSAEAIFFHEYAHHLMFQNLATPVPEWLSEGFAEFMSTAKVERDGSVTLGIPPKHRAVGLFTTTPIPLERLLTGDYGQLRNEARESIYGRGWLMTHYLTFEASRSGQLQAYLTNMAKGTPPLESARAAFGDLDKLRKDLDSYLERRRVRVIAIPASMLSIGRIEVSELTAGGAAIMPLRMESKHGVTAKTAEALAVKVRKVAAQYPGDPLVEITLAEAEIDAGHVEAAEVAADRALKTDPRNVDAMLFKGRALAERAAVGQIDALFDQARKWFIAANKIDPEDPEPLMLFHRSYQQQGIAPTTNAIAALHYASDLAPQDEGLRIESAIQYLRSGKGKEARQRLIPVAFDPHGDALAEAARTAIKHIDRGQLTEARRVLESGGESEVKATAEGTS